MNKVISSLLFIGLCIIVYLDYTMPRIKNELHPPTETHQCVFYQNIKYVRHMNAYALLWRTPQRGIHNLAQILSGATMKHYDFSFGDIVTMQSFPLKNTKLEHIYVPEFRWIIA